MNETNNTTEVVATQPLSAAHHVTFFPDEFGFTFTSEQQTLPQLRDRILSTSAKTKTTLPWLKLAVFGNHRSPGRSLRNNANVNSLSGIVAEHDEETIAFDDAVEILRKAGLQALVYTSPSHTKSEPRWRVVLPTSNLLGPNEHTRLIARLNGLFGGALADESFVLSQAYYFGSVDSNPDHRAEIIEGNFIDLRSDLDAAAQFKKYNGADHEADFGEAHEVDIVLPEWLAEDLNQLDPDISRRKWFNIGCCLYRLVDDKELGFKIWDRWSSNGKKYKQSEMRKQWRSIADRNGYAGSFFMFEAILAEEWDSRMTDAERAALQQAIASVIDNLRKKQQTTKDKPWPVMDKAAYYGLAGEVVNTIRPHTEADPVAILVQFLVMVGNVMGRRVFYQVEATRHYLNLYCVLTGPTAKGRKGTSADRVKKIIASADSQWAETQITSGLSSGEGLIHAVRDPVTKWDGEKTITLDAGVGDKRLLVIEPEFASALSVMERPGNTLSPLIRKGWDDGILATLTRNNSLRATGAHISIVGHITVDELKTRLTRTDTANGFANRFLFALVRRSQLLPFGGRNLDEQELRRLNDQLMLVIRKSTDDDFSEITWSDEAAAEWERLYKTLSADRPGLHGAVTARAEAQTVRLSMIYAVLDCSTKIQLPHLHAAFAVWNYCETSAAYIFGDSVGDQVADDILQALRSAGVQGLTRTEINNLFSGNKVKNQISVALALLVKMGRVRSKKFETRGRPVEVWIAI